MRTTPHRWLGLALIVALACTIAAGQDPAGESSSTRSADDLAAQAREFVGSLTESRDEIRALEKQMGAASGEDADVLRVRISERRMQMLSEFDALCSNILELEKRGIDASEPRKFVEPLLPEAQRSLERLYAEAAERETELRSKLENAPEEERQAISAELAQTEESADRMVRLLFENVKRIENMGLSANDARTRAVAIATERADQVAARIRVVVDRRKGLQDALAGDSESATLKADVADADRRLARLTASLQSLVTVLGGAEVETTEYQKLLVQTTGDVTSGLLDKDVALSLLDQWRVRAVEWIAESGPRLLLRVVVVVLILLLFRVLARITRRVMLRLFASSRVQTSQLLQNTVVSLASRAVFLIGVLVALSQLGVSLAPILAGLGVAGFIVGFALQDTLSNFASGGMILFYRPFDVGDMVEAAGVFGKVERMSLVSTTFLTIDHQTLIVPNSKIWGDVIRNVTAQRVRRVDLEFGISYSDDIPKAERVLASILEDHPKVLDDPAPMIRLHRLGESSVDFVVRPWCRTDDYWDVYWDVTREVKMRFDREGVSIPFPQRDVHVYPTDGKQRDRGAASPADQAGGGQSGGSTGARGSTSE